jgi:hypothetical protein
MQIYTKILIGMGVGAAIGLVLGPKSPVLEHDTYKIADSAKVTLLADPANAESALPLPGGLELDLEALETRTVEVVDTVGKTHVVPSMVRVEFEWTKLMSLKDKSGALEKALDTPGVGDTREA